MQLRITPSTYYSANARPESKRTIAAAVTIERTTRARRENHKVHGARKVHAALKRERHRMALG